MKIINISVRDYAGVSINLTHALQQNTEHEVRNISLKDHRYRYPTDIVTRDKSILSKWIDWADVVNCLGNIGVLVKKPKNLVVSYRGTHFRNNPRVRYNQARAMGAKKQLGLGPWNCNYEGLNLEWLPTPIPVDDWLKLKRGHEGKPIVCQSPSSFKGKNTLAIKKLISNKKNITLKIIHGVTWEKCMAAKADADIYVGSFKYGYGISTLEAMTMKIPVITHAKFEKEIMEKVGYLPYYNCKLEELPNAIDNLLSDKKLYNKYAMLCFNYVKKFHDYPVVAKKFSTILERVLNS